MLPGLDIVEAIHHAARPEDVDVRPAALAETEVGGQAVLRGMARAAENRPQLMFLAGTAAEAAHLDDGADAVAVDRAVGGQADRAEGVDGEIAVVVAFGDLDRERRSCR